MRSKCTSSSYTGVARHVIKASAALAAGLIFMLSGARFAASATLSGEDQTRLQTLLGLVAQEYSDAVADGVVIDARELEEAGVFLEGAESLAAKNWAAVPEGFSLSEVRRLVDEKADPGEVIPEVDRLLALLGAPPSSQALASPSRRPSPHVGAVIYARYCTDCHGVSGNADGVLVPKLRSKPARFTDREFMRGETPQEFIKVLTSGVPGKDMVPWTSVIDEQGRWDTVAYLWTLAVNEGEVAEGQGIYYKACVGCHGEDGKGDGPYAEKLLTPTPDLTDATVLAGKSDAALADSIHTGIPKTAMPAFGELAGENLSRSVAYVRSLAFSRDGGRAIAQAAAPLPVAATFRTVREAVRNAINRHQAGEKKEAVYEVIEAYLHFEKIEPLLLTRSEAETREVERAFLNLRATLGGSDDVARGRAEGEALLAKLDNLEKLAESKQGPTALFLSSLTIILREGFEAILVLAAIIAFLTKTGHRALVRQIFQGAAVAVAASFATAFAIEGIFHLGVAGQETLEGLTLLLASTVLFTVSYWLITKVYVEDWHRYLQGKVEKALRSGSRFALIAVAFLAVYREGFETVLFYRALLIDNEGALPIPLGFAVGSVGLFFVYFMVSRAGTRIPIRPFFLITGIVLYLMAFVFAGQGIRELQEGGVVGIHAAAGWPEVHWLGIFPTWETIAIQGFFIAACLFAVLYLTMLRPVRDRILSRREAGVLVMDMVGLHDLVEHIDLHISDCRDITRRSSQEGMREIEGHIDEADSKIHEILRRVDDLRHRLSSEWNIPLPTGTKAE